MRIAVIGAGKMGTWFARFWKSRNWDVVITDIDIEKARKTASETGSRIAKTGQEAVAGADVAMVAVPISRTPDVMKSLAKHMPVRTMIIDLASAKNEVFEELKKMKVNPELASLHPLFGPGASGVKGRTFISVPVKTGKVYDSFIKELRSAGAKVVAMTADDHDRVMAVTQSLTHFTLLIYLKALKTMKLAKKSEEFQTPLSQGLANLAMAFLETSPDLQGEIQVKNPYASIARSAALEACKSLDIALKAKDSRSLRKIFEESKELMGPEKTKKAYKKLYMEDEA